MDPETAQTINVIESLKARCFRSIDTKDWTTLDSVLADDVDVDTTTLGGQRAVGAANYVALLRSEYGTTTTTVHHGHMPEIALTSATSATGTWAMQVLVVRPDGKRALYCGHHHDTYGISQGRWTITATKSTRLHVEES